MSARKKKSLNFLNIRKRVLRANDSEMLKLNVNYFLGFPIPKPPHCEAGLGLESNAIPDSSLTASSVLDHFTTANGRLHSYEKPGTLHKLGPFGGWRAASNGREGSWFQVDFRNWTKVTRVSTQGSSSFPEWVTKYTVSYSLDGTFFKDYSKVITYQFHLFEGVVSRQLIS